MRIFIATVATIASISFAEAACATGAFSFQFGQSTPINATTDSDTSSNAGRCMLGFRGGLNVKYDSIMPLKRPTNGQLDEHPSKLGWRYTSKKGFKGTDTVSLRVCGKHSTSSGCTTVNYSITAR